MTETYKLVKPETIENGDGQNLNQRPKLEKRKIQLTWENIHITAMPATGRCKGQGMLKEPKTIIDGVSGTVMPGQFLAILGASGKHDFF